MPSGVIRLRNSKKNQQNPRVVYPVTDTSGYNAVDYRDDSVLRRDVHPNPWAPNGSNPRAPYPVVKGQGYHREMTTVGNRSEEPIKSPKKPGTFKKFSDVKYTKPMAVDDFDLLPEGKLRSRDPKHSS